MRVNLLILNYNGRSLLGECLPSVLRAANFSRFDCRVIVIDNSSTDDSVPWLQQNYPGVEVIRRPNRGLCSFNEVVAVLDGPVAVLLNNDIKLDRDAVDPLVDVLLSDPQCFMTAPKCWLFGGRSYEGFRTAVGWRWGLVQATALFPGHEPTINRAGLTASAGAALAVDRQKFIELGGFDPIYLPGRLEDLDFAFRGFMSGFHARYVPQSVVYHRGMATFGAIFGAAGCDQLAIRNTLLFQWKNLRHPLHVMRFVAGLPLRILHDLCRAPFVSARRRFVFTRALLGALSRRGSIKRLTSLVWHGLRREREFFTIFHPRRMQKGHSQASATNYAYHIRPLMSEPSRPKHKSALSRLTTDDHSSKESLAAGTDRSVRIEQYFAATNHGATGKATASLDRLLRDRDDVAGVSATELRS